MAVTELALAAEGTDYFLRMLDGVTDQEFPGPSLLPDWSRGHVVAHVAANARGLARLTEWALTGVEQQMYESREARNQEIEHHAALRPRELRELSHSDALGLIEKWRAVPEQTWAAEVSPTPGRPRPASAIVWMRTREVWLHAVDLNAGARFADFPTEFVDLLLAEITATWRGRQGGEGVVLAPDDRASGMAVGAEDGAAVLHGPASALLQWATGRGSIGITVEGRPEVPAPQHWL